MDRLKNLVSISEARTRLSEIIDLVEGGKEITITRHGTAVARFVPARRAKGDPAKAVARIKALRKGVRVGHHTLRELIEEGRP